MIVQKRALVTTTTCLVTMVAASCSADDCPCFTSTQYETLVAAFGAVGCQFTPSPQQQQSSSGEDITEETVSLAYLYEHEAISHVLPTVMIQAAVTLSEDDNTTTSSSLLIHGGSCAVHHTHGDDVYGIRNTQVRDYGDGLYAPEDFEACVHIMRRHCQSACARTLGTTHGGPSGHAGCGKVPFRSGTSTWN